MNDDTRRIGRAKEHAVVSDGEKVKWHMPQPQVTPMLIAEADAALVEERAKWERDNPFPDPRLMELTLLRYTLGDLEHIVHESPAYKDRDTKIKEDRAGYELRRRYLEPILLEIQKQRTLAGHERLRIEKGDQP